MSVWVQLADNIPVYIFPYFTFLCASLQEWTCSQCGCMLSPKPMPRPGSLMPFKVPGCSRCGPDAKMVQVVIPFAFKYMVAELASVGIATQLTLNDKIED